MALTEEKFNKQLTIAKLKLEDIQELSTSEDSEDVSTAYDQLGELVKRSEKWKDATVDYFMESDKELDYIKTWTTDRKAQILPFREARLKIKKQMEEIAARETQEKLEKELHVQHRVNEEQRKYRMQQQEEIEEAARRQQQQQEEWYLRKVDFEKQIRESQAENVSKEKPTTSSPQSVKLQRYTITPFSGDYKDWLRFWNQFTVEVDGSSISEISKFNYLLELVKGRPRDDILGLPHTQDGYEEAKRILEQTYGKDIKVHKALVKELEELPTISSIHRLHSIHDFYNKLSRVVRTLITMKRLTSVQSMAYTLMDRLGPVREVLIQKDDNWEEWGLEELVENLRKFVERNPLKGEEDTGRKEDYSRRPWKVV